ncbi:MAG: S-layer homology domain-containing protein [Clostridia bacterium]|nr:S-layer homology domain-containing protein [Clostridia bacterium]
MKKRLVSIIISIALLFCQVPLGLGSLDAKAAEIPGVLVLGDFSGSTLDSRFFHYTQPGAKQSTTVGYGDSTNSAEWVLNQEIFFNLDDVDWTKYKKVHIRVSSSAASNKFNLCFVGNENPGNSNYRKENVTTSSTAGTWTVASFPVSNFSTVLSNNGNKMGCLKFNYNGWGNSQYTAGSSIYIDSIWLTTEDYENSATMAAPTPSVADGDSYLASDLGNSNKLEFTFAKKLASAELLSQGVKVYDVTASSETLTTQDYSISVNDTKLIITFAQSLPNGVYKAALDSSKMYSESGAKLASDYSMVFSVGVGSLNFKISSTEPIGGATNVAAFASDNFEYKINFNNNLSSSVNYENYISLKRGDVDVSAGITSIIPSDKSLNVNIQSSSLYGNTTYTLSVANTLPDADGNTVNGTLDYAFTTGTKVRTVSDGVVFDAFDAEDLYVSKGQTYDTDTFIYDKVTGVNCTANGSTEKVVATKKADISGYTYVNLLLDNSSADVFSHNFVLRNSNGSAYVLYRIPTTKAGWQLVSLPLSSPYTKSGTLDKTAVDSYSINIGGWASGRPASNFDLKIGRIWFSTAIPASVPEFVSGEFGTEADFVSTDLGGDNAVSFSFDSNLYSADYSNMVKVEKLNGTDFDELTSGYSVETSADKLNVVFNSALPNGSTYRISIKGTVASTAYSLADIDTESVITVGTASPYFRVKEVSVPSGTPVMQSEFVSYDISFNNPIDNTLYINDFVTLYKDSARVFSGYSFDIDGKKLSLGFDSVPEAGVYKVELSQSLKDTYGNLLTGDSELKFTVSASATASVEDIIVFSANNDAQMATATANGSVSENTTNLNIYPKNVKITINADSDISSYFSYDTVDTSNMGYFNIMMYIPEECVEGNVVNLVLYKDVSANSYIRYEKTLTAGWNIISQPVSIAEVERVNVNFGGWATKWQQSGYALVEQIWFSETSPTAPELTGISLPDNYTGAAVSGQSITFEFSNELLSVQTPEISVSAPDGTPVTGYTTTVSGNKLTVSFGTLLPSTLYNIKIQSLINSQLVNIKSPVTYKFTTSSGGIYVKDYAFGSAALTPGETVTASFKLDNKTTEPKDVTLMLVALTKDGVLCQKAQETVTAVVGETPVSKSITTTADTEFVKCYVIDGNTVLDNKYIELNKLAANEYKVGITADISDKIAFDNPSVNADVIYVTGKATMSGAPVALNFASDTGISVASDITAAGADGSFSYGTKMPSGMNSGVYILTAVSNGKTESVKIKYFNESARNTFLSLSNGSDQAALASWLYSNRELTELPQMSQAMSRDIADFVIKNKPYNSYAKAYEKLNEITNAVTALNSSTWQTMAGIVVNNENILITSASTQKQAFISLNEKGRNAICVNLTSKLPFDSISAFTNQLDTETLNYINTQNTRPSAPSGGSSHVSVGGGASAVAPAPVETIVFNDLSGYDWAKESILKLYEKNIISASDNGKYRPADNITREEYIKLLVECFFKEYISSDEVLYTDAQNNAWYNKYLYAATKVGITNGKGDGSFGVGESITRQDMVTMSGRALEMCGYTLEGKGDINFTDSTEISDYAYRFVEALVSKGVLNGMGDGSFSPKANADRAQAAKVLCTMLEKYN